MARIEAVIATKVVVAPLLGGGRGGRRRCLRGRRGRARQLQQQRSSAATASMGARPGGDGGGWQRGEKGRLAVVGRKQHEEKAAPGDGFACNANGFEENDRHSGGRAMWRASIGWTAAARARVSSSTQWRGGARRAASRGRSSAADGERGCKAWTRSSDAHAGDVLGGGEVTIGHKASLEHVSSADGLDGDNVSPECRHRYKKEAYKDLVNWEFADEERRTSSSRECQGMASVHGGERNAAWHGSTRRGARNEEEQRGTTRWLGGLVRQPCPTRHFAEHVAGGVSACWRRQGRRGSRLGCKIEGELERE
uniref:Uncharacterized protein n=1 Tax=Oryza nivara TaxID=4536 RepID=A0A0E0ISE3_ORYNI